MRTLALDIGDIWTGTAISDPLGITARPYKTIETKELLTALTEIVTKEQISTLVIGLPITMRGTYSEQTDKILATKDLIKETFPTITIITWDERLTSKQAASLKPGASKNKADKIASHSLAAAIILSSYLMSR